MKADKANQTKPEHRLKWEKPSVKPLAGIGAEGAGSACADGSTAGGGCLNGGSAGLSTCTTGGVVVAG